MVRTRLGWFALSLLVSLTATVTATDWPQWLGPQRDGVWRETGLARQVPRGRIASQPWRTPLGTGYAGPRLPTARSMSWTASGGRTPRASHSSPSRPGAPVLGYERLVCFSAKDGNLLWEHKYDCDYVISYGSGPRSTPIIENGRVYMLGAMGDMKCLDAEKGRVIWEKSLPKEYHLKTVLDLKAIEAEEKPP